MIDISPEAFAARMGIDERSLAGLVQLPASDQLVVMDIMEQQQCKNPSAMTWSLSQKCKVNPAQMRLEYLGKHLDERASEALMKLPRGLQEQVALQMDFSKVRNLSAFCFSVIRSVQERSQSMGMGVGKPAGLHQPSPMVYAQSPIAYVGRDRSRSPAGMALAVPATGTSPGASSPMVQAFMMGAGLDKGASEALTALAAEEQHIVCALVEKQAAKARNPSAVTWSMCKFVRDDPSKAKMEYVKGSVDDNAAAALEQLDEETQEQVLQSVDVSRCRNVSAFIWSRVKAISGGTVEKNSSPAPRLALAAPPRQRKPIPGAKISPQKVSTEQAEGLDPMAAGLNLDSRCQDALRQLPLEAQRSVLSQLDENVRNPSAFIWSKIRSKPGK